MYIKNIEWLSCRFDNKYLIINNKFRQRVLKRINSRQKKIERGGIILKEIEAEIEKIDKGFPKTLILISVRTSEFNNIFGHMLPQVFPKERVKIMFEEKNEKSARPLA